jgi:hypothetical protein
MPAKSPTGRGYGPLLQKFVYYQSEQIYDNHSNPFDNGKTPFYSVRRRQIGAADEERGDVYGWERDNE